MTTVQTGAAGTYDVVSVAGDATGNLYAATKDPDYLIQVNLASGQTTTVVGTGTSGYNGNSDTNTGLLPGTQVQVNGPQSLSVALNGDVVFADTDNHLIRAYVPSSGFVADPLAGLVSGGIPQKGFNGDGHWADETELDAPAGVTVTRGALLVLADTGNSRVRQIGPSPLPPELGRPGPLPRAVGPTPCSRAVLPTASSGGSPWAAARQSRGATGRRWRRPSWPQQSLRCPPSECPPRRDDHLRRQGSRNRHDPCARNRAERPTALRLRPDLQARPRGDDAPPPRDPERSRQTARTPPGRPPEVAALGELHPDRRAVPPHQLLRAPHPRIVAGRHPSVRGRPRLAGQRRAFVESHRGRPTHDGSRVQIAYTRLREELELPPHARKLLSFSDNRQDASLQAGAADAGGELLRLTYRELPRTVRTLTGWDLDAEGE